MFNGTTTRISTKKEWATFEQMEENSVNPMSIKKEKKETKT